MAGTLFLGYKFNLREQIRERKLDRRRDESRKQRMMANNTVNNLQLPLQEDDDEWMDWETRNEKIPMWKHMIAGKNLTQQKC